MRYHLLIIVIFTFLGTNLNAQIDQEFWFAPPDLTQGTQGEINGNIFKDRPIKVVVSCLNEPAEVILLQPGNLSFIPIIVNLGANTSQTINLTPWINQIETRFVDSVMNTGILIRSTAPITAYYELGAATNRDIVALKGKNANGFKFYTPFQTLWENDLSFGGNPYIPSPRAGFAIVATDDSTTVTITPKNNIVNHLAGIPFTIFLNRGQTYYCEALTQLGTDRPTGTKIESDKPIAVTIKDDMVDLDLTTDGGADLAADQLISLEKCGLRHILVKGDLNAPFDKVFVLATEDSTFIFADGNPIAVDTLMEGEQYIYSFANTSGFIEGSKPIYVWHISGVTDQIAGAIIPSLECTGSNQVGFTREGSANFKLNLTIKSGFENNFVLNGNPNLITAADFAPVTGSNGEYVFCRKAFTIAEIPVGQSSLITNISEELFHMGITYQQAESCNYGYFTNFSFLNLGTSRTVCLGDSAILDAGPGKTSYLWSTGDTTQKLVVYNTGTFWVSVSSGSQCTAADTVIVEFYEPQFNLNVPQDTICEGSQLLLSADGSYTFQWQDGSINPFYVVSDSGLYWVEVADFQGCKLRDSTYINISPTPPAPIVSFLNMDPLLNSDTLCEGESITLNMDPYADVQYNWEGPNSLQFTVQQFELANATPSMSGTYAASYTLGVCKSDKSYLYVTVIGKPEINFGTSDTICDSNTLILDPSTGNNLTYVWQDASTDSIFLAEVSGIYSVEVTNSFGCNNRDSIALYFSERPATPLLLTDGLNVSSQEYCKGTDIFFITNALNGATFNWVSPTDTNITNNNTYILSTNATTQSGNYLIYLSRNGCDSYPDSVNLTFLDGPDFSFDFTDTTGCGEQEITLSIGNIPNVTNFWSTGQITPSINVTTSGIYWVAITNEIGCITRDTVSVNFISPAQNPTISGNSVLCQGDGLTLNSNNQNGVTYSWTGPNGFSSTGNSISLNNPEAGNYLLSASFNGCDAESNASVTVAINPNPSFGLGADVTICPGNTAIINGPTGFQSYEWSTNSTAQNDTVGAGTYNLLVTDINGCKGRDTINVTTNAPLAAFISNPASESITGVNVSFTDQSTGQISIWEWAFEDNISSSSQNPVHAFTTQGEIVVLLTVTDINGCSDTTSRKYTVSNILTAPNSFTPNGDGFNDLFVINGLAAFPDSKLLVFNRWGAEIYSSTDYSNDWNGGSYPDADYYYVLELSNGEKLKGFVTLKRN